MSKQVYISADYDEHDGDQEVVNVLKTWGNDDKHKVDFIDMSEVRSGTIANDPDCRICDLKAEFNKQINASSSAIFVVGNKTAGRTAGCACDRLTKQCNLCFCTPYKNNTSGQKMCKYAQTCNADPDGDCGIINSYSYLEHEFRQAVKKKKSILILFNSSRNENTWFPGYMRGFEDSAFPFWIRNENGEYKGDYERVKQFLLNE